LRISKGLKLAATLTAGLALHPRKLTAQVGVVFYALSMLAPAVPVLWWTYFPFLLTLLGGLVLFIASLMPSTEGETWGSMWPLVGYDNAIDAIYVRGPWRLRFEELDEAEAQGRVTTAMGTWF